MDGYEAALARLAAAEAERRAALAAVVVLGGAGLSEWRRGRGLSQARLAAALGITASYISRMERDDAPLAVATLTRLAAWVAASNEGEG